VVVWDMRGHGESDYPADQSLYSEALTVGDMKALLDQVGAKKAIIAGLSLGGYMSLAFAASHPERVAALMLFDTGPGFKKDEARAKWNETARQRADNLEAKGHSIPATRSSSRAIATPLAWPGPRAACWPRRTTG
jgi:pimeloyl-ACP methyl ester carboxylesterase